MRWNFAARGCPGLKVLIVAHRIAASCRTGSTISALSIRPSPRNFMHRGRGYRPCTMATVVSGELWWYEL